MLILTFEDREEEILNHIISYVSTGARAFQVIENAKTNLSFNGLEIDNINRLVRKQKQEIDLTFTEFEILYLLANNLGRVFSKEQIYDIVWKESYSGDYNIVMSHKIVPALTAIIRYCLCIWSYKTTAPSSKIVSPNILGFFLSV